LNKLEINQNEHLQVLNGIVIWRTQRNIIIMLLLFFFLILRVLLDLSISNIALVEINLSEEIFTQKCKLKSLISKDAIL
jgi:hypothetical protein